MRKYLFLVLIAITTIALSCSKSSSSNSNTSNFSGSWKGTFSGDHAGTWICTINQNGDMNGETTTSGTNYKTTISGTVASNGTWKAVGGTDDGEVFTGKITNTSTSGTWTNAGDQTKGTFVGSKQ